MAIEYLNPEDRYDIEVFNRNFKAVEDAVNHAELMQNTVWDSTQDGIISITAYDWDGELLGNFAFVKASDPQTQAANAQEAIDAFVGSESIQAKLTSHAGYDFLAWVKDDDSIPTSYGARVKPDNLNSVVNLLLADNEKVDFSTLSESTSIKAAYTTNEDIEIGETAVARRYNVFISKYGRAGTGSGYVITFKIERGNVPRLTQPVARVQMKVNLIVTETGDVSTSAIYSLIPMRGADVEYVDVLITTGTTSYTVDGVSNYIVSSASSFDFVVSDTYQYANPFGAAPRSEIKTCTASFTRTEMPTYVGSATQSTYNVWDSGTYVRYAIVQSLYDGLVSMEGDNFLNSYITVAYVRYCGVVPSVTNNSSLRNQALERWIEKGRPNFAYPTYDYATFYYIFSGEEYTNAGTTNNAEI